MLNKVAFVQLRATLVSIGSKFVHGWVDEHIMRLRIGKRSRWSLHYSAMEAQLYDFILDERAACRCVTGGMIRQEALRLLPETNFQASK